MNSSSPAWETSWRGVTALTVRRLRSRAAQALLDQGADEEFEREGGGDRVAGDAEDGLAAGDAEDHGVARANGDAMHEHLPRSAMTRAL